jgi:hypothetical protein
MTDRRPGKEAGEGRHCLWVHSSLQTNVRRLAPIHGEASIARCSRRVGWGRMEMAGWVGSVGGRGVTQGPTLAGTARMVAKQK